ncbi:DUF6268 family outer membrane beta-barrel protein [Blastopirellula marina]|uniref:DUF6268 domain-containing protein n=1 Tax=Blastopirellula marina TaxID=124 RepID=A0A2S8F6Q7_9BACT|nr:DUF6268 family outer membrane beta-barrel protein [Blastopirellula marina]PQO27849.1 hypothetical protein C5Y98_26330 [Blastopirellula marina]PTL41584.1 hypothetical protein C5Y97_26345 [Blastopirellula marina]
MLNRRQGWHVAALFMNALLLLAEFDERRLGAQDRVQPDYSAPLDFNSQPVVAEPPSYFDIAWQIAQPRKGTAKFTWLVGGGDDFLETTKTDLALTAVAPFPWLEDSMLAISPGFSVQTLHGPDGIELPSELYQATVNFTLIKPMGEGAELLLGFAPSIASDFDATGSDAFRFMGFATYSWQASATTKWMLGAAATGREDIPVLPMVGVVWNPSETWQVELTMPRPRVAHRLDWFATANENWTYVAGEFGGGTWAVDRNGQNDEITLRDFRLVLGWEQRGKVGLRPQVEIGYVFGRNVEYDSDDYQYQPADTVMLRAGFSF